MLLQVFLLIVSLAILYFGAEFALESGEKVGRFFGMSHLVIGLLIVGFGTSLPEFFVSQISCFHGHSDIALGNVIGSNIANIFLIMGSAALFVPLHLGSASIKHQCLLHLVITFLLVGVLFPANFTWISSAVLVVFFIVYLYQTFKKMKKEEAKNPHANGEKEKIKILHFIKLIIGFVFLYFGGELLVSSGSKLGTLLGISEYVISAIFVAFGTSFPELVTAMVACYRKKDADLITGNVIGSNIFNIAFVLGSLGPYNFAIKGSYLPELATLVFVAFLLIALSHKNFTFRKIGGVIFLCTYVGMVYYWQAL
ncbi:MAG: calcium/sodium antiporter [Bacteriovoracaceae bacterium]|nr:calcium/sodium antiporter [Bacteriovoracaceae bacterium]